MEVGCEARKKGEPICGKGGGEPRRDEMPEAWDGLAGPEPPAIMGTWEACRHEVSHLNAQVGQTGTQSMHLKYRMYNQNTPALN